MKIYQPVLLALLVHGWILEATLTETSPPDIPAGTIRRNARDGLEYVWVPPGGFLMGCGDSIGGCTFMEKPAHRVQITLGFWIGRTEVPVFESRRFVEATESEMPAETPFNPDWRGLNQPMVNVTWHHAATFCEWAGGRLPTEAEWEYAARGGLEGFPYPWGDGLKHDLARYGLLPDEKNHPSLMEGESVTAAVGLHPPNGFGLQDVIGNVEEWCLDVFDPIYYGYSPSADPAGPEPLAALSPRVLRGGSWRTASKELLRLSYRRGEPPDETDAGRGFRCVIEDLEAF